MLMGPVGAFAIDESVAHEHLGESMTCSGQIFSGILSASTQVAHSFLGFGRWPHDSQHLCPCCLGELSGIPTVGLDALSRLDRDQRGRDDIGGDSEFLQLPLEAVAAGSGLVDALELADGLTLEPSG